MSDEIKKSANALLAGLRGLIEQTEQIVDDSLKKATKEEAAKISAELEKLNFKKIVEKAKNDLKNF